MALGQLNAEKIIKDFIESNFSGAFKYEPPHLIREDEKSICFLLIQTSNLGRLQIGVANIKLKQIDDIVVPILNKNKIINSKWNSILQSYDKWKNLSHLKADSESELDECLIELKSYIENIAIPFWTKYSSLEEIVKLSTELDDLTVVFNDEVDFNVLTALYLTGHHSYENKKTEFKKNQNQLAEYSNEYKNYPIAFENLITTLESKNALQHGV